MMRALICEDPAVSSRLRAAVNSTSICRLFHYAIFVGEYTRVRCNARWRGAIRCNIIDIGIDVFTLFVRGFKRDDLSYNGVLLVREVGGRIIILPCDRIIGRSALPWSDRADRNLIWVLEIENALIIGIAADDFAVLRDEASTVRSSFAEGPNRPEWPEVAAGRMWRWRKYRDVR
jgi:hypothetical protein